MAAIADAYVAEADGKGRAEADGHGCNKADRKEDFFSPPDFLTLKVNNLV